MDFMNRIKILFLIDFLSGGGAERVLCTLASHLDPEKFAVTVQTVHGVNPEGYLAPQVRYRAINRRGRPLFDLWLRLCAQLGWAYPLYIRENYDIEVAFLECFPTKLLAASTNRAALKLAWVHCDLKKKWLPESYFAYYRSFDRVVCVSRSVRDSFVRLTGRDADIVENVLDAQSILKKSREFTPESDGKFTFAAVGRLSKEKGFDRLITAARQLRADGFDFSLWLIGDGPERSSLEAGAGDTVRFWGYQENPYPYMAAADAILVPSRTEGCSTVAAEAMILGKTIAATDCPGMADLLQGCGVLTENSEAGIYDGMKHLLTDPVLRAELAAAAKERGSDFSKEKTIRRAEGFLLRALEEKRGVPWKFT